MSTEDLVYDLVAEWDRRQQEGEDISAEIICADHPELAQMVAERIAGVKKITSMMPSDDDEDDDFLSLPSFNTQSAKEDDTLEVTTQLSLDEFASCVTSAGLMTAAQLSSFQSGLLEPVDANELARQLVKKQRLTMYQAEAICEGKSDRLVYGDYVILDRIGAGGMGQVFKAQHRRMKRIVALKILPPEAVSSPNAVERFEREVEAAARLLHPNIVVAHDAGEANGVHYLVMEYVDGSDLSDLVKKKGPVSVAKAVNYIKQAATGLAFAHGKGVVHRDIKPANLLLDGEGVVKILDMGLARIEQPTNGNGIAVTQAELTQDGSVLGTIDYMSPEQALNTKHADARADIYSLGCSLYYILTGSPAFVGNTLMARMLAHREGDIPSLADARPGVPAELDAIFEKMVAKEPADRYQTCAELLSALETIQVADEEAVERDTTVVAETYIDAASKETSSAQLNETVDLTPKPAEEAPAPQPMPATKGRGILIGAIVAVATMLLGGSYWAAVVFRVEFDEGTVLVEIGDSDKPVEVAVTKDRRVKIIDPNDGKEVLVTVEAGASKLTLTKEGFKVQTETFSLKSEDGRHVKVSFVPVKKKDVVDAASSVESASGDDSGTMQSEPESELVHSPNTEPADSVEQPSTAWPLGPSEDVLPGLFARPTSLPGIKRWNAFFVAPWGGEIAVQPGGRLLAVSSDEKLIRYIDLRTSKLTRIHPSGLDAKLSWDSTGDKLAILSSHVVGYELDVRDNSTGTSLGTWWIPNRRCGPIAWHPDGNRIAIALGNHREQSDHTEDANSTQPSCRAGVQILDVTTGEFSRNLRLHGDSEVWDVAFSPNGRWLASSAGNGVQLWDVEQEELGPLVEMQSGIRRIAWSPDSSQFAGTGGKQTHVWDIAGNGGIVAEGNLIGFWPENDTVLLATRVDRQIRFLDMEAGNTVRQLTISGNESLRQVVATDQGGLLVYDGIGNVIHVNASSGRTERIVTSFRAKWVGTELAWQPEGDQLLVPREDGRAMLWRQDGSRRLIDQATGRFFNSPSWHPDGTQFVAAVDNSLRFWSSDGSPLPAVPDAAKARIVSVSWHPHGDLIAYSCQNGAIYHFDCQERTIIEIVPPGGSASTLDWNRDGSLLAARVTKEDVMSFLLLREDGSESARLAFAEVWTRFAWCPDDGNLYYLRDNNALKKYDPIAQIEDVVRPEHTALHVLAFSPDGRRVAYIWSWGGAALLDKSEMSNGEWQRLRVAGTGNGGAWDTTSSLLATISPEEQTLCIWNGVTGECERVVLLLGNHEIATFSGAGQFISATSEDARSVVAYLVETEDGTQRVLSANEFETLVDSSRDP